MAYSIANGSQNFCGAGNGNALSVSSALENRFLLHYERSVFNQIVQNVGESIDEFANRIRCQAAKCKFQDQIHNLVMLDRFIAGLVDRNLRNILLAERNITFEDAYNLSRKLSRNCCAPPTIPKVYDDYVQRAFEPSVSVRPTCPTEDLLSPLYPKLSPLKRGLPCNTARFPTPLTKDIGATNFVAKPAVGTYVMALKSDFQHTRGNPPIWKVTNDSGLLETFIPFVEGRETVYKSSAIFSTMSAMAEQMFEKVQVEKETKEIDANGKYVTVVHLKARTEFTVGTYIVLKSDLKSKENPPIWRVLGASIFQKFVPTAKSKLKYYRSDKFFIMCTDWTWRLSDEDYCEVPVLKEFWGNNSSELIVIRLENNALQLAKAEMNKQEEEFNSPTIDGNSKTEFAVGAYVVLKSDVEKSFIWRVHSPFSLQKFNRQVDENGDTEYIGENMYTTCLDSRWQEFYKIIAVTVETTKVDPSGHKVMTARLKEDDPFQLKESHLVKNDDVNESDLAGSAENMILRSRKNFSNIKKTRNKKIKKTQKGKIRHRICCGLITLFCCCV